MLKNKKIYESTQILNFTDIHNLVQTKWTSEIQKTYFVFLKILRLYQNKTPILILRLKYSKLLWNKKMDEYTQTIKTIDKKGTQKIVKINITYWNFDI